MADFDALKQGMDLFYTGMQKFSTNRAINQAQEQVQTLNTSETDEFKKRQQLANISQNLTFNLTKAGANAQQIQQNAAAIMPAAIENADQAYIQGQLTGSPKMQQLGQNAQNFKEAPENKRLAATLASHEKIALMAAEASQAKARTSLEGTDQKAIQRYQDQFNLRAKDYLGKEQAANTAEDILKMENPVGDQSIANLMVKMSGDVGNITEFERKPYKGSLDLVSRTKQATNELVEGKLTPENRVLLEDLVKAYKTNAVKSAGKFADHFARQASKNMGKDFKLMRENIYEGDQPGAQATIPSAQSVRVRNPKTGKVVLVPANQLDAALKAGGQKAD